jgi:hypothetical protein
MELGISIVKIFLRTNLGCDTTKQFKKILLTLLMNIKQCDHRTKYEGNNKFLS